MSIFRDVLDSKLHWVRVRVFQSSAAAGHFSLPEETDKERRETDERKWDVMASEYMEADTRAVNTDFLEGFKLNFSPASSCTVNSQAASEEQRQWAQSYFKKTLSIVNSVVSYLQTSYPEIETLTSIIGGSEVPAGLLFY